MENDRKTQIIKAAVKRFAKHGLNKTTLAEIARDLRIGKATIYHYFNSKEELFYKTIEYDASLFIQDIKQIFNNDQILLKERFVEYFIYKKEIYVKYKLLYDVLMRALNEAGLEKEYEVLKNLLKEEEDVLKIALNDKTETINPDIPKFLVINSWGLLFGKKLNDLRSESEILNPRDLLFSSLGNLLR